MKNPPVSKTFFCSRLKLSLSLISPNPWQTPANMALQLHINVSLNRPPDRTWRRPPGRPRNNWLDQLRNDSTLRPTGELWRRAVDRGHGGATTWRPSPATRPWWWWWWWWTHGLIFTLSGCLSGFSLGLSFLGPQQKSWLIDVMSSRAASRDEKVREPKTIFHFF